MEGWCHSLGKGLMGRRLIFAPVPISLCKAGRCDARPGEILPSPQTCSRGVTWLETDWKETVCKCPCELPLLLKLWCMDATLCISMQQFFLIRGNSSWAL